MTSATLVSAVTRRAGIVVGLLLACLLADAAAFSVAPAFADGPPPSPIITRLAGNADGSAGGPIPGPAINSGLYLPDGMAVDAQGNVYVADNHNYVVEKITPTGTLSVIAGQPGQGGDPTAGLATQSSLNDPTGIAVDASGDIFIADAGTVQGLAHGGCDCRRGHVIVKIDSTGTLSVLHSGAPLALPEGIAVDNAGDVLVADAHANQAFAITPEGQLSIFAGDGTAGPEQPGAPSGSPLDGVDGVAVDGSGDVYISESHNDATAEVNPDDTSLSVLVSGLDGRPQGVAVDSAGNVYIAEYDGEVDQVTPSGVLSVIAGTGVAGPAGS